MKFFKTQNEWRTWLMKNHSSAKELLMGFYRKSSGKGGITYPEALDEALCFGWIDGIRKGIDESTYTIRFTPRKPSSIWSNVNIKHVARLKKLKLMHPAGMAAFKKRTQGKSGIYAFEQKNIKLPAAYEKKIKANKKAWQFFSSQAPWYKRTASYWVISARQEATRLRRLQMLIDDSENELRAKPYRLSPKEKKSAQ